MPLREGARVPIRVKVTRPSAAPEIFVSPSRLEAEFRNVPLGEQETATLSVERRFGDVPSVQVKCSASWIHLRVTRGGVPKFRVQVTVDTTATGLREGEVYRDEILFLVDGEILTTVPVVLRVRAAGLPGEGQKPPITEKPSPSRWLLILISIVVCLLFGYVAFNLYDDEARRSTVESVSEPTPETITQEEWSVWARQSFPYEIGSAEISDAGILNFSASIQNLDLIPHTLVASYFVKVLWADGHEAILPGEECTGFRANHHVLGNKSCVIKYDIEPGEVINFSGTGLGYQERPFQIDLIESSVFLLAVDGYSLNKAPPPIATRAARNALATATFVAATADAENIVVGQQSLDQRLVRVTVEDFMTVRRGDYNAVRDIGFVFVIKNETDRLFEVDVEFGIRYTCFRRDTREKDKSFTVSETTSFMYLRRQPLFQVEPNSVARIPFSLGAGYLNPKCSAPRYLADAELAYSKIVDIR